MGKGIEVGCLCVVVRANLFPCNEGKFGVVVEYNGSEGAVYKWKVKALNDPFLVTHLVALSAGYLAKPHASQHMWAKTEQLRRIDDYRGQHEVSWGDVAPYHKPERIEND